MSLCTLINKFVATDASLAEASTKARSIQQLKGDKDLKSLSQYVRGGLSKMTKPELTKFISALKVYKKDTYRVDGKEITPDEEQKEIINGSPKQNIRVLAGAGTGKTTTIGCRIKNLLDTETVPDKILVLTFNVEARKDLEKMIDELMGYEIKLEIRTIDSFCNKLCYERGEQNANHYSLSELAIRGRKIIEGEEGEMICKQYKYVFFDEFQDVNADQFRILKAFVNHGSKLTVIGDDNQNIYQFRGSDNYYIINFDKIVPNTTTYKLTTNYRSTKEIVDLANDSILNNKEKIFKQMVPFTDEKGTIDLTVCESSNDQHNVLQQLLDKITYYADELCLPYEEIAVLSRTTKSLKTIETEFERVNLPYVALISDQYSSSDYKQVIQEGKIVLSTIHKAKGLEWSVVFIVGLTDAIFPSHMNNGLKNIEEERRLFYVAVTRAKRHLHFMADRSEVPLSRFIGEVEKHVTIIDNSKQNNRNIRKDIQKAEKNELFDGSDEDKKKDVYSVTKIIEMISGRKLEIMREKNLLPTIITNSSDNNNSPDIIVQTEQIFQEPLCYTDAIKKNIFEADYGIFCDYYMTRQLMIDNYQPIKDTHVEMVLLDIRLTSEEKVLYNKYDIRSYFINGKYSVKIDKRDGTKVRAIVDKIMKKMKQHGVEFLDIEHVMKISASHYNYPTFFMDKLVKAYDEYKDIDKSNAEIIEAIYFVSLCRKFSDDRRRLVYRDIQDLYKENSVAVFPRIDSYTKKIKRNSVVCKSKVNKLYKIDKQLVLLAGELDYIDVTNGVLVDIKCSEGDFKVEWVVQLLMYYALFMHRPESVESTDYIDTKDLHISKIAIINIFSGKYYEMHIPENYDWKGLLDFIQDLISNDLKGIREKHDDEDLINLTKPLTKTLTKMLTNKQYAKQKDCSINVNMMLLSTNRDTDNSSEHSENNDDQPLDYEVVELDEGIVKEGYMVLDVENNCTNQDIIQLAYIVYDDQDEEVKRFNNYIKDRFADRRLTEITGITNDFLKKNSSAFGEIMREFLIDLNTVKAYCGHNVGTDIKKIVNNLDKYQVKPSYDIFNSTLKTCDTMTMYRSIKGKSTALNSMYKELFNLDMVNAHDALSDVEHTAKCFVKLRELSVSKNGQNIIKSSTKNSTNKTPIKSPIKSPIKRPIKSPSKSPSKSPNTHLKKNIMKSVKMCIKDGDNDSDGGNRDGGNSNGDNENNGRTKQRPKTTLEDGLLDIFNSKFF